MADQWRINGRIPDFWRPGFQRWRRSKPQVGLALLPSAFSFARGAWRLIWHGSRCWRGVKTSNRLSVKCNGSHHLAFISVCEHRKNSLKQYTGDYESKSGFLLLFILAGSRYNVSDVMKEGWGV